MLHDRSVKIGTIYNPTILVIGSCRYDRRRHRAAPRQQDHGPTAARPKWLEFSAVKRSEPSTLYVDGNIELSFA
jgi:hypothetical protein